MGDVGGVDGSKRGLGGLATGETAVTSCVIGAMLAMGDVGGVDGNKRGLGGLATGDTITGDIICDMGDVICDMGDVGGVDGSKRGLGGLTTGDVICDIGDTIDGCMTGDVICDMGDTIAGDVICDMRDIGVGGFILVGVMLLTGVTNGDTGTLVLTIALTAGEAGLGLKVVRDGDVTW